MATPTPMQFSPNAAFDIFPTIATYLDPHLVIPILDSDFYKSLNVRCGRVARRHTRRSHGWSALAHPRAPPSLAAVR